MAAISLSSIATWSWPFIGAVAGVVVVLVYVLVWFFRMRASSRVAPEESFGMSPGTMTQLASSHVGTEGDVAEARAEIREAEKEADDMTSEHPPL